MTDLENSWNCGMTSWPLNVLDTSMKLLEIVSTNCLKSSSISSTSSQNTSSLSPLSRYDLPPPVNSPP